MRTSYLLRSFWRRDPHDPVQACGEQLWRFLDAARWLDPRLDGWRVRARTRDHLPDPTPLRSVGESIAAVEARSFDRSGSAGSALSLDNGQSGHSAASCDYLCGLHGELPLRWCPSSITLSVFARRPPLPLSDLDLLEALLFCVVHAFRPEWGVVGARSLPAIPIESDGRPAVGWITYLSSGIGRDFPAVSGVRQRRVGEHGTILSIAVDAFDLDDRTHVDKAEELSLALERAGLLRPLVALENEG